MGRPQEGFLFSKLCTWQATVADNIRGRPGDKTKVEAAARAIGAEPRDLGAARWIRHRGGRARRPALGRPAPAGCLRRAWLADLALLILDEATSSLDVATETRVTERCGGCQDRATIVIAHRLSTVIEADQIAVIEDGRVVEPVHPTSCSPRRPVADLYGRWLAGAA